MNYQVLLSSIFQGESQISEFNTPFQIEVIGAIVIFANTAGGSILVRGMIIDKLLFGNYLSCTKNCVVANLFKEYDIIEPYGLGIKRIKNACLEHGVGQSVFEEQQKILPKTLARWVMQLREYSKIKFWGSKKTGGYFAK